MSKDQRYLIVGVVGLIIFVLGVSLAYFIPQLMEGNASKVDVISKTTDQFTFSSGKDLSISINQQNLAPGVGNVSDYTTVTASLLANNDTNHSEMTYYVYLNIESNEYKYTTEDKNAEIVLVVTDPEGNPVTNISGLKSVTANGVSGFDITEVSDFIEIANAYPIVSNSSETPVDQTWKFEIHFINLDSDQEANTNKRLTAYVRIFKNSLTPIAEACVGQNMSECIIANYASDRIFYHDSNLTNGAEDLSYRYSGANPNNYVCFGTDENPCPVDNLYRIIGLFDDNKDGTYNIKLIKYDYATNTQLGTDGDYHGKYNYIGSDYYKGSNYDNIAGYYWNNKGNVSKIWSTGLLNKTNLNTNYIEYLGSVWSSKIAEATWQVGGINQVFLGVPSTAHINEVGINSSATTYNAKIGLMYVSDYGFAASQDSWTTDLYYYNEAGTQNNWMYMGLHEWTISLQSSDTMSNLRFYADIYGNVRSVAVDRTFAVRPVFYLNSSVYIMDGAGSMLDPYIIGMN